MRLNGLLVGLFFLLWSILNLVVGFLVPFMKYAVGIPYFLVMQVINMGIAYDAALLLLASLKRGGEPPKLDRLDRAPPVALLYLTYNDAMPEALSQLNNQSYGNHNIFVLDDSTDQAYMSLVNEYEYVTIRRGCKRGAKAGNLNHWLSLYGDQFEYFVVLDNGGLLDETFIENMLRYAEHPANGQVAIFQSLTRAWNTDRLFSRLFDAMNPLNHCINLRVLNRNDSMLCWGHNILCRTKPIQEIGGFDERFATEDFATNLRLIESGYQSKAVNVTSFDLESETAQFHTIRMTRWARGTLETAVSKSWNLPFTTKLRMIMGVHSYSRWFFYILGMLMVVWGYQGNWEQLNVTLFLAFRWHRLGMILYPLTILTLYILYALLIRPLWVMWLVRVSWKAYWGHSILSTAVNFYALFYIVHGQIRSLLGQKAQFINGEKRWHKTTMREIIKDMKWTLLLSLALVVGLVRKPVACITHSVWYIPLFFTPLIIYWVQNLPADGKVANTSPNHKSSVSHLSSVPEV